MHLNLERAIAATGLATTTLDVERETPLLVTSRLGVRRIRVELTNVIKQSRVRRGVRARRTTDRGLIAGDHLVENLDALNARVRTGANA